MNCKWCGKPVGLIHRCKPEMVSPKKPLVERARTALMMNEAGYDVLDLELMLELAKFVVHGEKS